MASVTIENVRKYIVVAVTYIALYKLAPVRGDCH
jgi:hypothetical protein